MRFSFFRLTAVISLISFNSYAQTKPSEVLTWIRWNDPPIFIFNEPFKSAGILDIVEKQLQKALPQYDHKELDATVPRVLKEAESKNPICNAGWLNTPEWSKLFYFSKPVAIIPTNGVLISENKLVELSKMKVKNDLQSILNLKPDWVLGVGRLYGEGIDDILKHNNYMNNPKIFTASSSLLIHRMLNRNRVQYTLGYPFEAQYYNELFKTKTNKIVHIPLTDNTPFVEVVVACPKTQWGAKVISDVNRVLNSRQMLENINHGLVRWLSPADQKRLSAERAHFYNKNYPGI